jgi:hypothetical protein
MNKKNTFHFLILVINFIFTVGAMENGETPDQLSVDTYAEKNACWLVQGSGINGIINTVQKERVKQALTQIISHHPELITIQCHPVYRLVLHHELDKEQLLISDIPRLANQLNGTLQVQSARWVSVAFKEPVDIPSASVMFNTIPAVIDAKPISQNKSFHQCNLSMDQDSENLIFTFLQKNCDDSQYITPTTRKIVYNLSSKNINAIETSHE